MHNSYELLHQAFALFLFCSAVTLLFIMYRNYTNVVMITGKVIKNDIMYEQHNEVEEITYSKGEIISLFLEGLDYDCLDYDIEINGLLISNSENVKDNISAYSIPDKGFKKTYVYDGKGNINRIIFKSIN